MKQHRAASAAVAKDEKTSAAIELHQYDAAMFHIPANYKGTNGTLAVVGSNTIDGTYSPMRTSAGSLVAHTVTVGSWHAFSSSLFGIKYVKLVSTNTAQSTTGISITISGHGPTI